MASTSTRPEFASTSSSSLPPQDYDVFLSFRGEDTRKEFTDHIYAALVRRGIITFRYDDSLSIGEEIGPEVVKAIVASRISVILFSRKYADSRWCLDGLVKIMECKRTFKQIVLPVFYDVDPSDVRAQRGSFAEAFSKHGDRYKGSGMEGKVEMWRAALTEAANLSGYDLRNMANGHESKFFEKIVEDIWERLNHQHLNVAQWVRKLKSLEMTPHDDIQSKLKAFWKWLFVISNISFEILALAFDQVSSPSKPGYALAGLVMSLVAVAVCLIEFGWKARKAEVTLRRWGPIWWFYYRSQRGRLYGTFAEIFGIICAILQVIFSAIEYGLFHQHAENPIKMSIIPVIFALCVSGSKLINDHNEGPPRGPLRSGS